MTTYDNVRAALRVTPRKWLVTGVAGFIGSNLLETLLQLDQFVLGLDNFSRGRQSNLEEVQAVVTPAQWARFRLIRGDIRDQAVCRQACAGVDCVLHQAALGSVPGSIADPLLYQETNVSGFLNLLVAAREAKIRSFVYASSSAVYGDDPDLPKQEQKIGQPLSPYAAGKVMNELYARVFSRVYDFSSIGLRYFNVFGPRQDAEGAYAAVIPRWIRALLQGQSICINGDGETSRDFCFVENVVQANLLAATVSDARALNQVYNVALGERTTLKQLFAQLQDAVLKGEPGRSAQAPVYQPFRSGDVRHSLADVSKAKALLGYEPTHRLAQGLDLAIAWHRRHQLPPAVGGGSPPGVPSL